MACYCCTKHFVKYLSVCLLYFSCLFVDPAASIGDGLCEFPEFLHRRGPWMLQYRLARHPLTGERLATDEVQFAEASILRKRQSMGSIVLRRFQIRLVRGTDTFKESLLEERRESVDCVERSATNAGDFGETFVAAHYKHENSTRQLSGFSCISFREMKDETAVFQTFAAAVDIGPMEDRSFSVDSCTNGDANDKWLWTPEPQIADFKAIQCPRKFSYRVITDWVDASNASKPRLVNTRSGHSILQQNTFTLVQSQCIFGLGMSWLYYNILPENFRRAAVLSLRSDITALESIQEDMQCAGSWIRNTSGLSYQFILIYRPDFPQAIYTLRLPLDEPAQVNYSRAMLYEGASEVLSPGVGSNLRMSGLLNPPDGDKAGQNRYQLSYRKSLGDCDNHIRGCEFSEQHHLTNSVDLSSLYCRLSLDLDGNQCATSTNMGRCSYSDDIRGNWVRLDSDDSPDRLGQVSIGFDAAGAVMRLHRWSNAQFPATDFVCRKNFLLMSMTGHEGVYVIRKVSDRMCASTQSCMQVVPTGTGAVSTDGRLQSLKNVIFMRISHDTALSENEMPKSCSFMEKIIEQRVGETIRRVPVSYLYTLISENLLRQYDDSARSGYYSILNPSSMYCKINLYAKYNFSAVNTSRHTPCLLRIESNSQAYDNFYFKFLEGSEMCESDLRFLLKKHSCLGGYDINYGSFNPTISPMASLFHVVVTYYVENGKRLYNCWLIEKSRSQSVIRMLAFDSAQCRLLFSADTSAGGAFESPAYLEAVEESLAAVALYNPGGYPVEARMDLVRIADSLRQQQSVSAISSVSNNRHLQQQQQQQSVSSNIGDFKAGASAAAAGGGVRKSAMVTTVSSPAKTVVAMATVVASLAISDIHN